MEALRDEIRPRYFIVRWHKHVAPLVVIVIAVSVPVGLAEAAGSATGQERSPDMRADFNGDEAEDLAVGAPGETVGTVPNARAVNVTYGAARPPGNQLFT